MTVRQSWSTKGEYLSDRATLVVTCTSSQQALRIAALFSFDAVLLDYQMPEMSGHELLMR